MPIKGTGIRIILPSWCSLFSGREVKALGYFGHSHILTPKQLPYQIPSTFSRFCRILALSEFLRLPRLPSLLPTISPFFRPLYSLWSFSLSPGHTELVSSMSSAEIFNEIEVCLILRHGHLDSLSSKSCCNLYFHHNFRFSLWISAQLFTKLMLHN